jgi:hypothetical protein
MRKIARIIAMAIYVALWMLAFLVMTTDAPLGRRLLIPLAIGALIGGITWHMTTKISRGFRRLSLAAGLLGFISAFLFGAPVFVDTFDPKNPPTWFAILIPNAIVSLPYAMLPATMLLLAGWVVGKVRNRN